MSFRNPTDLHDVNSFDHVGRDSESRLVAGSVLTELAANDDRIVAGTADLTYVTRLGEFAHRHPDRFFQFGISERNMLSAMAGMATCGLIPYAATFACFSAILAYENIRTDLAYPNLPVRILATHAGISMGFFGTSHHATEDIGALRGVANLMVLSPPDASATEALIRATVDHPGPIYFRLGRGRERPLYSEAPTAYGPGDPRVVMEGQGLLITATGIMVQEALAAGEQIEQATGWTTTVLDVHTLKPFSSRFVADLAAQHRLVLSVEEHNIEGGLGTLVQEAIASNKVRTPVYKHGLYDEFGIVGPPTHLYAYYGLDTSGIAEVAERFIRDETAGEDDSIGARYWNESDKERILTIHNNP
ncbi:MAG: transketolase C-terminal domain-containing protein [Dehalococcoidia bacterium]